MPRQLGCHAVPDGVGLGVAVKHQQRQAAAGGQDVQLHARCRAHSVGVEAGEERFHGRFRVIRVA